MIKVLVVDDDAINVELLEEHLKIEGYEPVKAYSGEEGWKILENRSDISLILLDRMMPGIDGITFMEMLNESKKNIPVIMQTAAADHNSIVEGIDSGVYYYLTKPFTHDMLISIMRSALNDLRYKKYLLEELDKNNASISLIRNIEMRLRTPKEAYDAAYFLARSYPDPEKVILGMIELLTNAIEHGNLNIGFEGKGELLSSGRLANEINRRLHLPENLNKYVSVKLSRNADEIVLSIKDCGRGFDYESFFELKPERADKPNGRGLLMTRIISFDELEYLSGGSEVICRHKLNEEKSDSNVA